VTLIRTKPTPYIIGGLGFVGGTIARAFDGSRVIDVAEPDTLRLYDEMRPGDVAFICVPTPYDTVRGRNDDTIVGDVFRKIPNGVIKCLRSTVMGCYVDLADVVHPEFLRQATADEDFRSAKVRVYGVAAENRSRVDVIERMYTNAGIVAATIVVEPFDAALLKFYHNAWCAVNVSLANEFATHYESAMEKSWNDDFREHLLHLLEANGKDFRAFSSVPGPDGKRGFGGACFPKDLSALRDVMRLKHTVEGALRTNAKVRLPE
jgi:UDP-glucose 6-dehydrogenase